MNKGFSVVLGMSLAYGVSFFGLLLAYIVYQRNHHKDELWRLRPIGISFFGVVYGYVLPVIALLNALITVGVKAVRGWDYNLLIWNTASLLYVLPAALLLFLLIGRQLWRLRLPGYLAGVAVAAAGTVWTAQLSFQAWFGGVANLHVIGAAVTGLIWHALWTYYLLRGRTRQLFSAARPVQA